MRSEKKSTSKLSKKSTSVPKQSQKLNLRDQICKQMLEDTTYQSSSSPSKDISKQKIIQALKKNNSQFGTLLQSASDDSVRRCVSQLSDKQVQNFLHSIILNAQSQTITVNQRIKLLTWIQELLSKGTTLQKNDLSNIQQVIAQQQQKISVVELLKVQGKIQLILNE